MDIEKYWQEQNSFFTDIRGKSLPHGGISLDDANELYALMGKNVYNTNHNRRNPQIAELGCWTGMSTVILGNIAKENGGRVVSIDSFKGAETDNLEDSARVFNIRLICETNLKNSGVRDQVELIDSKTEEAASKFPDEHFDAIFIDADHRYAAVKKDIELWTPKVKKGGLICGHDCDILLTNGLESIYTKWGHQNWVGFHLGVARAVTEAFPLAKKVSTGVIWYTVKQ